MSSETNNQVQKPSAKTPDIWVRRQKNGLYEWATPKLGCLNSFKLGYVKEFMEARGLTFQVVPAREDASEN
jgi:hypothetical protein